MFRAIRRWITESGFISSRRAPAEAILLRCLGIGYLLLFIVSSATARPHPGLQGRGLAVLLAMIAFLACVVGTQARRSEIPASRRVVLLLGVTVASAVLAALQPNGIWQAGPYFVGIVAALRLERLAGVAILACSLLVLVAVSAAEGHGGGALSVLFGAVPWFLVIRLMRETRDQQLALEASRAAEARAAAAAERGRFAREVHDVLAHSLSALALQLESTRLLARDRGVDPDVTKALDQAHHLAASGLDEARRAISTVRGDRLPGPERLAALTKAFGEQSGLPAVLEVRGDPRELAPDARLAVYRTAQEALTNVRRHAAALRVDVQLNYRPDGTALVVEDYSPEGTPPPLSISATGGGFGLTGMRERAELLGGTLEAGPTTDGFRVELWIPAAEPATAAAG